MIKIPTGEFRETKITDALPNLFITEKWDYLNANIKQESEREPQVYVRVVNIFASMTTLPLERSLCRQTSRLSVSKQL